MPTKAQSKPDIVLYALLGTLVTLLIVIMLTPKPEYKVSIMNNRILATTNSRTGKVRTYNVKRVKDGIKLVEIKE